MRRALIVTATLAAVSLVTAPVLAGNGNRSGHHGGPPTTAGSSTTTTEAPTAADLLDCEFRGVTIDGNVYNVLHYDDRYNVDPDNDWIMWNGDEALFCDFYEAVLPASYVFAVEPVPDETGARAFTGPYVLFKEEHPGSDFCYQQEFSGKYTETVLFGPVTLPALDANGDQCTSTGSPDLDGPNVFTLTPHVIKAQGGAIWLRMVSRVAPSGS